MPTVSKSDWHKMLATVSPRRDKEAARRAPRPKRFIVHRTAVEGDVLTLDIPLEVHSEKHPQMPWRKAKETRRQREIVGTELLRVRAILPPLPVVVTLVRLGPKRLDRGDNLSLALSATKDEVAKAFGIDDADPRIEFRCEQIPGSAYGVRIQIREAKP